MDDRAIILRCLSAKWQDAVDMIGDDVVARIVDDALLGKTTPFRPQHGGYNLDLSSYINEIISAASLLVSLAQLYYAAFRDTLTEEDMVRIVAQELMKKTNVEHGEAIDLVHMFIRISRDDHQTGKR